MLTIQKPVTNWREGWPYLLVIAAEISVGWVSGITSGWDDGPAWSGGIDEADILKCKRNVTTLRANA